MSENDKQIRLKPESRREPMLRIACELAKESHYLKVTRDQVAEKAGVCGGTVQYVFRSMPALRRGIMQYAVEHEVLPVIAQGLASKNCHALAASDELKRRAVEALC